MGGCEKDKEGTKHRGVAKSGSNRSVACGQRERFSLRYESPPILVPSTFQVVTSPVVFFSGCHSPAAKVHIAFQHTCNRR